MHQVAQLGWQVLQPVDVQRQADLRRGAPCPFQLVVSLQAMPHLPQRICLVGCSGRDKHAVSNKSNKAAAPPAAALLFHHIGQLADARRQHTQLVGVLHTTTHRGLRWWDECTKSQSLSPRHNHFPKACHPSEPSLQTQNATTSPSLTSDSQVSAVQAPMSGGSSVMSLECRDRWSSRRRLEMVSGSVPILLECRSASQAGGGVRQLPYASQAGDGVRQ